MEISQVLGEDTGGFCLTTSGTEQYNEFWGWVKTGTVRTYDDRVTIFMMMMMMMMMMIAMHCNVVMCLPTQTFDTRQEVRAKHKHMHCSRVQCSILLALLVEGKKSEAACPPLHSLSNHLPCLPSFFIVLIIIIFPFIAILHQHHYLPPYSHHSSSWSIIRNHLFLTHYPTTFRNKIMSQILPSDM